MSVAELKEEVQDRGLDPTSFKKADLQKALKKSIFGNEDFGDDESKTGKKRKNGAKEYVLFSSLQVIIVIIIIVNAFII